MVRVQCVLWPRDAAEATTVQAELWEPLHHGPPTPLCQPHPARVHTGLPAPPLLPLGGQLRLEHGRSTARVHVWELHHLIGPQTRPTNMVHKHGYKRPSTVSQYL